MIATVDLEVEEITGENGSVARWESLFAATPNTRFFDTPTWILNYWRYRHRPQGRVILVIGKADGRVVGLAPLAVGEKGVNRLLPTLEAVHATGEYEADWICDPKYARGFVSALWDYLEQKGQRWYRLRMSFVRQGSAVAQALREECWRRDAPMEETVARKVPFLKTDGGPRDVDGILEGKYRRELTRRRRKLEQLGPLQFEDHGSDENLRQSFSEFVEVESSGWKGEAGSAIKQDPRALNFWWHLAADAATRGMLRLHLLRLGDKPIAGQLGVVHRERYYCLKLGYDESYKTYGPGALLTRHAIQSALTDPSVQVYDFAGPAQKYMWNWTRKTYELSMLSVGSTAFGFGEVYRIVQSARTALRPVRHAIRSFAAQT